jgi:uncharacterized protein YecT (DUF1311 family)
MALAVLAAGPAHSLSDQDYRTYLAQSPEFKQADQDLNQQYRDLLAKLDPAGQSRLKKDQKRWLQARDARAKDLAAAQGLALPLAYAQVDRQRAAELPALAVAPGLASSLASSPASSPASVWAGQWERVGAGRFDTATLNISQATSQGFAFELEAMSGGNSGEASGQASIQGAKAWFIDESGCRLDFKLAKGRITLEGNQACQSLAGMGVHFDGQYARVGTQPPAKPAPPSPQEKALADLTGKYYETFQDTMQMQGEDQDLDGLGAKVTSYGVRGLFTAQESIVMHGARGKVWAAVIDGEVVRYFSNDPAWLKRLPRTIEDWRSRFVDKQVIFMSGEKP